MESKSLKAIAATVSVLCLCITLVGCGGSESNPEQQLEDKMSSMSDKEAENEIEKAAESIEAAEGKSAETTTTLQEITYEPCDEIINADFSSGLVQIGNDLFHCGGYFTVDQFIEEYSDRYDMSDINPNGLIESSSNIDGSATIVSLNDPSIKIGIQYRSGDKENKIKVGEAIVFGFTASRIPCWYPKGIPADGTGYDYDNIPSFLEENGYKRTDWDGSEYHGVPDYYGAYWCHVNSFDNDKESFMFNDIGTEKNLFDCYPLYKYWFSYHLDDAKAHAFMMDTFPTDVSDLNAYPRIG